MNEYKWIQESGCCLESEFKEMIRERYKNFEVYIALYTDSFECKRIEVMNLNLLNCNKLLEIRLFNKNAEFYAVRGTIGKDFSWRLTNDDNLDKLDYVERIHYIDINESMEYSEMNENGNKCLITTVGGMYSLPIKTEKRVKIRSYITYDDNGSAKVVDNRICGFID